MRAVNAIFGHWFRFHNRMIRHHAGSLRDRKAQFCQLFTERRATPSQDESPKRHNQEDSFSDLIELLERGRCPERFANNGDDRRFVEPPASPLVQASRRGIDEYNVRDVVDSNPPRI